MYFKSQIVKVIEQGKVNFNLENLNYLLKMLEQTLAWVNAKELSKNDQ